MKVTVIKPKVTTRPSGKKQVAAYARVSTLSEDQSESFESQVDYYTKLISSNPDFDFVGVYADHGISATQAKTRPDFMRMLDDARAGKIDVIYCKSISRFCRNAADCQSIAHELKSINVEIIFEKEGLSTFNPMSEMVFNFMSIIAQEESRSISENTTWALEKLAEKGIRHLGAHRVLGYTEKDGVLVPDENANLIRFIFEEYTQGVRTRDIVEHLKFLGAKTLRSGGDFTSRGIQKILSNIIYKGDRLLQKQPHRDYITHKPDPSKEFNQYYIKGAHEPLVSEEIWNKAQEVKIQRKESGKSGCGSAFNKEVREKRYARYAINSHPLFGKVLCSCCGEPFKRNIVISGGVKQYSWHCMGKNKHNGCKNHGMLESKLLQKIGEVDYKDIDKVLINEDKTVEVIMKELPIEVIQFFKRAEKYNLLTK